MIYQKRQSMKRYLFIIILISIYHSIAFGQINEGYDEDGFNQSTNTFNPSHRTDTTKTKKVAPRGMYVWTVEKRQIWR